MNADPRARDFVFGALSPAERASIIRARLYDRDLDSAIAVLEAQFGALGLSGPSAEDPGLWDSIDAAIDLEDCELAGKRIEAAADGKWFDHAPGIEAKRLWPAAVLLRCVPGARDAAHEQDRDEHIVVIAGDLIVGGRTLGTGDHLFLPVGTHHPAMRTVEGCLLFIQFH
ncbi:hypothetical protein OF829_12430 [Sphingomonas sp. LB-2]|uniref:cupin domain-containing protein n=1 Tax=Sphingomonas caeni TaxID=2984949 RepID=UPI00223020DE|nr:cupin domain-containing protein [Sphingomonas caeni]MCW3848048.1 hypothetical protein [Sphingomonas caeni]